MNNKQKIESILKDNLPRNYIGALAWRFIQQDFINLKLKTYETRI